MIQIKCILLFFYTLLFIYQLNWQHCITFSSQMFNIDFGKQVIVLVLKYFLFKTHAVDRFSKSLNMKYNGDVRDILHNLFTNN